MKIFKSVIPEITREQFIKMPLGAKILSIQIQHGNVTVWYLCQPEATMVNRRIAIYGTGHEVNGVVGEYLATIQIGTLVWHYFDLGESVISK